MRAEAERTKDKDTNDALNLFQKLHTIVKQLESRVNGITHDVTGVQQQLDSTRTAHRVAPASASLQLQLSELIERVDRVEQAAGATSALPSAAADFSQKARFDELELTVKQGSARVDRCLSMTELRCAELQRRIETMGEP